MRLLRGLCAGLLLAGCAAGGVSPAGPVDPADPVDLPGPVDPPDPVGPPGPVDPAGPAGPVSPPVAPDADCLRALRLAEQGEHKPAVDLLAALPGAEAACDREVLESVSESERTLAEADTWVRRGLDQRRQGDLEGARESFHQALLVYPKYQWIERLEASLLSSASEEAVTLQRQAANLLAAGQLEKALRALEAAAAVSPKSQALGEILRLRNEIGDARLDAAGLAQRAGNLQRAAELTARAVAVAPEGAVAERAVEFARQLGLQLYSAGQLVQAEAIWRVALSLEPDNELVLQYLDEVASRLRSLDQIKKGDG